MMSLPKRFRPPWGFHKPCVASQLPQLCASPPCGFHKPCVASQLPQLCASAPALRFPPCGFHNPCVASQLPQLCASAPALRFPPCGFHKPCVASQLPQLCVPPWGYHKPGFKLFSCAWLDALLHKLPKVFQIQDDVYNGLTRASPSKWQGAPAPAPNELMLWQGPNPATPRLGACRSTNSCTRHCMQDYPTTHHFAWVAGFF